MMLKNYYYIFKVSNSVLCDFVVLFMMYMLLLTSCSSRSPKSPGNSRTEVSEGFVLQEKAMVWCSQTTNV